MPTLSQVEATLPHAFKEKYPNTYSIIDASEFFLERPSDLRFLSLPLGVTTGITTLLNCSLHAHLMVPFPTSHDFMLV